MSSKDVLTSYGERLLPQVVEMTAQQTPDRVVAMMPRSLDVSKGFVRLTLSELVRAVDNMAYWIEAHAGKSINFEPISYVGVNDFRYWVMELAAIKCRHPILLLSVRNSDAHNLSLFKDVKCSIMMFTAPFEFRAASLRNAGIETFAVPTLDTMISMGSGRRYPYDYSWNDAKLDPIVVAHTSGSTGAPKPITYNHRFLAAIDSGRNLEGAHGRRDVNISLLDGTTWFFAFPAFHVLGVAFGPCSLFFHTVCVLGHSDTPANAKMIVDIMAQVELGHILAPPTILDDLAKNYQNEFIEHSGSLRAVQNGGGPLAPATGDFFVARCDVLQLYGATEAGKINNLVSERQFWQWFEWNPKFGGIRMEKVEEDEEIYELTIHRIPGQEWCQAIFLTHPDLDVWRSRDYFRKHPTRDLYQFDGRRDDVIVLNNGEKFNPVGMETIINSHPLVTGALVAGQSKDQLCLILEGDNAGDDLIERAWPKIQQANKEAPTHARIYNHMVMTTSPGKPFPRAAKGTIQRPAATKMYAQDIEALYGKEKKASPKTKKTPVLKLPKATVSDFIRQGVAAQLDREDFADADDLYSLGFDSLQTTQLAETLSAGLATHMPPDGLARVSARLIYENPTVDLTTDAIIALMNQSAQFDGQTPFPFDQTGLERIRALVKEYSTTLPRPMAKAVVAENGVNKLTIAVTGTTGFLGFYLLKTLLDDDAVGQVICLNRSPKAAEKFKTQHSAASIKEPSTEKLEFLQTSFGKPNFGLSEETHQRLVDQIDVIIHNAWQVDFNLSLSSFVNPHIVGIRGLLKLVLKSERNAKIVFVSTIATVAYWPGFYPDNNGSLQSGTVNETHKGTVREQPPSFSRIPSRQGYAQSKYVAEAILTNVAASHKIPITIVRPGQITDSASKQGPSSSSTDWFPLMLQTSKKMGLLPESFTRNKTIDFIPVDAVAETIARIIHDRLTNEKMQPGDLGMPAVYNLVNPRTVAFAKLIPSITARFETSVDDDNQKKETKIVSIEDWFQALDSHRKPAVLATASGGGDRVITATTDNTLNDYPALKLHAFFEGLAWQSRDKSRSDDADGEIQTTKAREISKAMRDLMPVTDDDLVSWMKLWKI